MDARPVACISSDKDFAPSHGVTGGIADIAVNHDFARVHGIAYSLLGIRVDRNDGAVQISAQGIARNAADRNAFMGHPGRNIALPAAFGDSAVISGFAEGFV